MAGHRRNDDAKRLRHDDVLKNEAPAQTERHGGIPLPPRNGLYAAAYDLGDEGRGIGDECHQEREVFRRQRQSADKIKARSSGMVMVQETPRPHDTSAGSPTARTST